MAVQSFEPIAWISAPAAKEQQRLEHGVGEQMEHTRHVTDAVMELGTCDTERHHHEGNLRDGGECKHTLDVDLCTSHDGGVKCRNGTNNGDNLKRAYLHQDIAGKKFVPQDKHRQRPLSQHG